MTPLPDKIDLKTATKEENIRKIKYYININENISNDDLGKLAGLHPNTVCRLKRYIRNSDLRDEKFVNPASEALLANLKNENMAAVKLVYDHINRGEINQSAGSGGTTININFDGMSNKDGSVVIDSKTSDATKGGVRDINVTKEG